MTTDTTPDLPVASDNDLVAVSMGPPIEIEIIGRVRLRCGDGEITMVLDTGYNDDIRIDGVRVDGDAAIMADYWPVIRRLRAENGGKVEWQ